ncbi:receptor-like cytosolic serine threonine-protein kinase RBK2-like [Musa troglodytarum]|uniref:non-specific serine/threonine protein kinase n=1 Tax=Musa troglodytarum TaxID=320322 RepID=A0A9E7FK03_9LILI|nr:receptor-like cytosolic serine threonine-protein kinase RBK2-like [Musa troglodytarum]
MEELGGGGNGSPPRVCAGKPPRHGGTVHPARDRHPAMSIPALASSQDLRCLHLEKEAGEALAECSPRGVLDDGLRCSDSETTSKASTSYTETQMIRSSFSLWHDFFRLWKHKSMRRLSSFPPIGFRKRSRRRRSNRDSRVPMPDSTSAADNEFSLFKPTWRNFTISELEKATNNFNPENMIGKGGSAEIYRGCLANGQLVAVKKITRGTTEEKTNNFLSEMGVLVHVDHPNTARLIGVGVEGGMHLVLVLSPHGSLANLLHDSKDKLDWGIRYKVAVGTAKGVEYLHERCHKRIIHRDIKAANILLTEDFEPQICDFGLAKWLPDEVTHHTLPSFEGTFGYLAPEYCMHGVVDEKTDVFAFGILLLELISGRRAVNSSQQSLLMWAKPLLEQNQIRDLIDPSLGDSYDSKQMDRAAKTAYLCIQHSSVLKLLSGGDEGRAENGRALHRSFLRRTYSEEIFDAEEYNATRYLSDITRHKQIAFDF